MSPYRRTTSRRRSSRPVARQQRITFKDGAITFAGMSANTVVATDLTAQLYIEGTTDLGPGAFLRAKYTSVRGEVAFRPSTVGTAFAYHMALIIAPDTLDTADFDPGASFSASATMLNTWFEMHRIVHPTAHLRSLTASTFENELSPVKFRYATRGQRRLQHGNMHLWLFEVCTAALTDRAHLYRQSLELH